jgi:hypothetical protein
MAFFFDEAVPVDRAIGYAMATSIRSRRVNRSVTSRWWSMVCPAITVVEVFRLPAGTASGGRAAGCELFVRPQDGGCRMTRPFKVPSIQQI